MTERLQKILAARGLCSRRKAEEWITAGRVGVNGQVAALGQSADPELDTITLDGKPLPAGGDHVYIMLHKPRGYVTTLSDEKGRPNVTELVDCGQRVYPIGRLDMDSEGLLLLTNDGEFAYHLMHPKAEVNKTYEVWVTDYAPGGEVRLVKPITIDGYTIRAPKVKLLSTQGKAAHLYITIHEGRNRQIRRMCQAAGMRVTRLRRIAEGTVTLGDLKKGTWRYLTAEEIDHLKK
ncbi:MAG: rRNA pseudouridine synthase [Oscillospiraceae bacterium]|nr:rRNA pseudouridine synthase [Oscillospiraceae bacterium]